MAWTVEIAGVQDTEVVARIGRETFYETWRDYNTPEDMALYLQDAFDHDKVRKDLANSEVNTFFLVRDGARIGGYAKVRRDRIYPALEGTRPLEIERVDVFRELHGEGLAATLMGAIIRLAQEEGMDMLWLGVNIDNARAIRFYRKYGFEIFGSKLFQLGKALDEDYLMKAAVPVLKQQQ